MYRPHASLALLLAVLLPWVACNSSSDDTFPEDDNTIPGDDDDDVGEDDTSDDDTSDDDDDSTADPADAVEGAVQVQNSANRSGSYYLPQGYNLGALPVLVAYHGTGGSGSDMVAAFRGFADASSFIIIAPDSRVSPGGDYTWEVGVHPGEITEDLTHTQACLDELLGLPDVTWNAQDLLAAGFSGGASSAPYMATNDHRFSASATLHGGVFVTGLGDNIVRAWFSTGEDDTVRPPDHVQDMADDMEAAGFPDVEFHLFPGGHQMSEEEREALVAWWLG